MRGRSRWPPVGWCVSGASWRTVQTSASHRSYRAAVEWQVPASRGDQNGDTRFWKGRREAHPWPERAGNRQRDGEFASTQNPRNPRGERRRTVRRRALRGNRSDSGSGGRRMTRFSLPSAPQKFSLARSDECSIECGWRLADAVRGQETERHSRLRRWTFMGGDADAVVYLETKVATDNTAAESDGGGEGVLPGFRRDDELWAADSSSQHICGDRQVPGRSSESTRRPANLNHARRARSKAPCIQPRWGRASGARVVAHRAHTSANMHLSKGLSPESMRTVSTSRVVLRNVLIYLALKGRVTGSKTIIWLRDDTPVVVPTAEDGTCRHARAPCRTVTHVFQLGL
ncbi:hypothetical protein C8Q79DRAFT_363543 [Trametes meyenii]|nr:hypothetical protein C8Q79DRAFT_363543 [Trametes meyenii]